MGKHLTLLLLASALLHGSEVSEPARAIPFANPLDWNRIPISTLGVNLPTEGALSGYVQWAWNESGLYFKLRLFFEDSEKLEAPKTEIFIHHPADSNSCSAVVRYQIENDEVIIAIDSLGGDFPAKGKWIEQSDGGILTGEISPPFELNPKMEFRLGYRVLRESNLAGFNPVIGLKRQHNGTSAKWISNRPERFPLVALKQANSSRYNKVDIQVAEQLREEIPWLVLELTTPREAGEQNERNKILSFELILPSVIDEPSLTELKERLAGSWRIKEVETASSSERMIISGVLKDFFLSASGAFHCAELRIPLPITDRDGIEYVLKIKHGAEEISERSGILWMPGLVYQARDSFSNTGILEAFLREVGLEQISKLRRIENMDVADYFDLRSNWDRNLISTRLRTLSEHLSTPAKGNGNDVQLHTYVSEMDGTSQPFLYWPPEGDIPTEGSPLYLILLGYNTINDRYNFAFGEWLPDVVEKIKENEPYLHEGHIIFLHGRGNSYGEFGQEDLMQAVNWAQDNLNFSSVIAQGVCYAGTEAIRMGLRYPDLITGVDAKSPVGIVDMIDGIPTAIVGTIPTNEDREEIKEIGRSAYGIPKELLNSKMPPMRIMVGQKDLESRVSIRALQRMIKSNNLSVVTLSDQGRYFYAPELSQEFHQSTTRITEVKSKGSERRRDNFLSLKEVMNQPLTIVYGTQKEGITPFLRIKALRLQEQLRGTTSIRLSGYNCRVVSDELYLQEKDTEENLWMIGGKDENLIAEQFLEAGSGPMLMLDGDFQTPDDNFGFTTFRNPDDSDSIIVWELARSPLGYLQDIWPYLWFQSGLWSLSNNVPALVNLQIGNDYFSQPSEEPSN